MGFFDSLTLPAASLIGSGFSAILGYAGSRNANDKSVAAVREQNEGNMRLAQYQYEKNLESWNMQNAYNHPAAQMQRLKAAGLNPNLIYGSGSANTGLASSAPQYTAPRLAAYTDFSNEATALSGFMDQALKAAQIYKTEQETDNLRQYQKNMMSDNELKKLEIIAKGYENAKTELQKRFWLRTFEDELGLLRANRRLTENKATNVSLENDLTKKFGVRLKQATLDNLYENRLHSQADRALMSYRMKLVAAQANLTNAEANRILQILPLELVGRKIDNGIKGIEFLVQKHARELGINPNNTSEVGTIANFLVGAYHTLIDD